MQIDWDNIGLGKKSDTQIALELGVLRRKVCSERNKRKIKPFLGLYLLTEGIPCRSVYEAMYDVYLHENKIQHKHEVKIGTCIADFEVGDEIHEIAGMTGFRKYQDRNLRKEQYYKKHNIKVKWLTCKDVETLYQTCSTKVMCRDRKCIDCGKETVNIVRNVCRTCYMKRWHDKGQQQVCEQCGNTFVAPKNDTRKFCSHACYSKSIASLGMDYGAILKEITETKEPVYSYAKRHGIKPATLYVMLNRQKNKNLGLTGEGVIRKRA